MAYTTIDLPTDYFNTILYTGTGSSNARTGVGFQPDWVWIKGRSGATDHGLYDAVRGVQNQLESNTTTAETAEATGLTAFGTDGFTVGALAQLNTSAATYVAWNWKANGAGVSNTAGTISSTVSANTTAGFSIVSYTGNGSSGATVGHGLGVAPKMVIVKRRNLTEDWMVNHTSASATAGSYLKLNDTIAVVTGNAVVWNNTNPSSTVVTLGTDVATNGNGSTYIAYCFADVKGYSKFGSYTGNNSTDGAFVYTGFKPAFIIIKATNSATQFWTLIDNKRNSFNMVNLGIGPNSSNSESTFNTDRGNPNMDFVSNGFKFRTDNSGINGTLNYIYMAFAENPFVTSGGIPTTAR
jgi:hypothetical protein